MSVDAGNDGSFETLYSWADDDGDGVDDLITEVDTTGDGMFDLVAVDYGWDETTDLVVVDSDGDGVYDTASPATTSEPRSTGPPR
jgi:hypothetical protein